MRPTITEYALRGAAGYPDRPAVIDIEPGSSACSVTTYGELADSVGRARSSLVHAGVQPGQTVALIAPTSAGHVIGFHAIASAGAIVTPMNPSYTTFELSHQLQDSEAIAIVCFADYEDTAKQAAHGTGVERIVTIEELTRWAGPISPAVGYHDRPVALPYSSGTTGRPKGVMLGHSNLVAQCEGMAVVDPLEAGHACLAVLPLFHILGMQIIMNHTLPQGGTIVALRRFDPLATLDAISRHRVTRLYAVPPVIAALVNQPTVADYDLSSLRDILTGAAPMGPEMLDRVAAAMPCIVRQGFGMTELAGGAHIPGQVTTPDHCGAVLPGLESRIVDASGAPVPPGERGEVRFRGPQVMQGYWRNPEATAATIIDGWLCSGDLGRLDEEGNLTIVGRLKELIKCNGFQVAPAELEDVLATHPAVADSAVVGAPDERAGEIPVAFVVLKPDHGTTADELMAYVNGRLARYKHLHRLEFVAAVPRTPAGKILRRELPV